MGTLEKNPFDSTDDEEEIVQESDPPIEPHLPEDGELVVKPYCECFSCQHWTKSADWCPTPNLDFECEKKKSKQVKIFQPLLRTEKHPGKTPKISVYQWDRLSKIEKQKVVKTLVHGEIIPEPVEMFTETYFSQEIQHSLKNLNYKYSLPIQSFAWPAIFRQMNVFMIGSHNSGKTMSYLPAILTFSTMYLERYEDLSRYKGPLVIILCSNSKQCEEIYDLIKTLCRNVNIKAKVSILTYPITKIQSTDILITMPETLTHCLKQRIFNLKRLCHLVLEDGSTLLTKNEEMLYTIFDVINEMLEHRVNNAKVQLLVSSEKWTKDLKKLLQKLYATPLVCIGNYLEAAFYGSTQFEIKFLTSHLKKNYLIEILQDKYKLYKTVVICDQDELIDLNKHLVRNGIRTIALSENSSKEEIDECEIEWVFTPGGQNKVLICTDFVFDSLLSINDAMWLINYSFPTTWTRFVKRFSALSAFYRSPLDTNEDNFQCKSFIMIDEFCEKQMGKILNFLNRLSKDFPTNYQRYAEAFLNQLEFDKVKSNMKLCPKLKLFGKCSKELCEERHLLNYELDISDNLHKCGKIQFKILSIKDVSSFSVQLLKHIDLNGCTYTISEVDLRNPLEYESNEEKKLVENVKIGKFYAHCDYTTNGEEFTLCHVLDIEQIAINVLLINGLTLRTMKNKLFELPKSIKIADVYLCNLIPPMKDESFSGRAFHLTRQSLENVQYKTMVLTGSVFLQLDNTFWLDDVVQQFNIDGTNVVKFNLNKHLLNLQVVEIDETQISYLHKLCQQCDITLPIYMKQIAKKSVNKSKEVEPQMAFLDDNINEIILSSAVSPDEFYVRLAKFQNLLDNLENELQKVVSDGFDDVNVIIGKYYLATDPQGLNYSRVKILNIEKNRVLCYYVDYGDEAIVDIKTIKMLPTKYLTKLPFQAIQCRLFGLYPSNGEWSNEATDILYKFMFEPESDIFRSLFIETRAKDDGDLIRAKVKYSVVLKDGFGDKNILVNQLFLDCGLATSIFNKIDDFYISQNEQIEVDEEIETEEKFEIEENLEIDSENIDDFDCEINNIEEFLKLINVPFEKLPDKSEDSNETVEVGKTFSEQKVKTDPNGIKTPEVFWSQTDKIVQLKIKLVGVENYKTNVIQRRIFTFSTKIEEECYELKFTLRKPAELGAHCAYGQEVRIKLVKIEAADWDQLTGTTRRMRNIHYEVPNEKEEPKRKFLQLDITDSESERDDGVIVYEFSDMDSEFDHEIVTSSEED